MALEPFHEPMDVPGLYQLRQYAIAEQDTDQPGKIGHGQGGQSDSRAEGTKGNQDSNSDHQKRQPCDLPGGTTLKEWDLACPDHVDDECLRQQSLDEPA